MLRRQIEGRRSPTALTIIGNIIPWLHYGALAAQSMNCENRLGRRRVLTLRAAGAQFGETTMAGVICSEDERISPL